MEADEGKATLTIDANEALLLPVHETLERSPGDRFAVMFSTNSMAKEALAECVLRMNRDEDLPQGIAQVRIEW